MTCYCQLIQSQNTYDSVNKRLTKTITASMREFNLLFDAASGGATIDDYVITSFSQFED